MVLISTRKIETEKIFPGTKGSFAARRAFSHPAVVGLFFVFLSFIPLVCFADSTPGKTGISQKTPAPKRYVVKGAKIYDTVLKKPLFFRGIGYSPYLPNETPLQGASPGDDGRYEEHLGLMKDMGVNYLHVFPLKMPPKFFAALDKTDMLYGQDIWIWAYEEDFLAEAFLEKTLADIKSVIDHVYLHGRPDRLVLEVNMVNHRFNIC
ncbi:MAG: hypothetical protein KKC20_02125, partial [Proteobacteria bacterium]|nr:hypothetical protein [Pseudomonadota bacterium]